MLTPHLLFVTYSAAPARRLSFAYPSLILRSSCIHLISNVKGKIRGEKMFVTKKHFAESHKLRPLAKCLNMIQKNLQFAKRFMQQATFVVDSLFHRNHCF